MTHRLFLNDRGILLVAALAGGLAVSSAALADVPPANAPIGSPQQASERLYADAQKALKSGNPRLALIHLRNALTSDPRNTKARLMLGVMLNLTGDSAGAEREFRQARKDGAAPALVLPPLFDVMMARGENQLLLNEFPDPGANVPGAQIILMARAMAFQKLNKPAEAVDASDRALGMGRDATSLVVRARIALMQGQLAEARKFIDEAIPKATSPDPMLFKVGLLLTTGEAPAALELSNKLLEKFPGNAQARYARIEAYLALNQDDKAKAEVDDILAKTPNNNMALYDRAMLLARAGNASEAWRVAQAIPPEFRDSVPRVALMVAQIAAKAGNDQTGAAILGRLLLKDPGSVPARVSLATFHLGKNNVDEALKVLQPVKDSQDVQVRALLATTYVRLGRKNEALDILRKLESEGKANPDTQRSIALLEMQVGQKEQGLRQLAQLNAKEPTNLANAGPLIGALVQAKRYAEALAVADRLGADASQRSKALALRGSVLLAQNNMAGAQAAFDKAVAADPKSQDALFARAQFLTATQKYAEAGKDLQAMLAMDPRNVTALLTLADLSARQNRDQDVRNALGRAIAAAPQSAAPRLALVRFLLLRRDFKNGLSAATEFARVQPSNAEAVTLLGNAQFASGQKKEAVATFRRLAALTPTAAAPQVLLSETLAATGDRLGAVSAMEAAVKRAPNSPDVRAAQIKLLWSQGNNEAAVTAGRAYQAASPGPEADILLSETLEKAKQHDQAVAVLSKSFADKPNNLVLMKLVNAAIRDKNTASAGDLMSKWVAAHPDDVAVRMEYASFLMEQGDARAVPEYESAFKQNPENPIILNNLGWLIQASNPKRALTLLTKASELAPGSADIADTLGWLKVQQKDAAGGLVLLNKAHGLKPKDGAITYHLVVALDANAKRDAARGLLKALLASGVQFKDRPQAEKLSASWR